MNGYIYRICFTVTMVVLLPISVQANTIYSSVNASADTGGNTAASNTTVITGTAHASVDVETVTNDHQNTSTVYINTETNGHTYSRTYSGPGIVHVSVGASSTGHAVQIHYATSTSRVTPSSSHVIISSPSVATNTSSKASSFVEIVTHWFSNLFRFLGW